MKVYAVTNAWSTYDTIVEGMCYGVYSTFEKAKEAMKRGVEETKENWVESDMVEDEDEIEITEEEDSCTLVSGDDGNYEIFKIEEIEVDVCFNN